MELENINYHHLMDEKLNQSTLQRLENALFRKGIVGIQNVPTVEQCIDQYVEAARKFAKLTNEIKSQYAPNRDIGETEGYELGAEWFKNKKGNWQIDDKKASYYAFVPDHSKNKWPHEIDLKTPYLNLGKLIFAVGKLLLKHLHLDLKQEQLLGYGRMLHYHKTNDKTNDNPLWCGAHFDHGLFTGLIPAIYLEDEKEIDEPPEAGLFIIPSDSQTFEKVEVNSKNILIFQVGEFGQLISNDSIKATKHCVYKAKGSIERYSYALFYSAPNTTIYSNSALTRDLRYQNNQIDGKINYDAWEKASYEQYRAAVRSPNG